MTLASDLTGPDGAPEIVLVHGITESRRSWDPVVERLRPGHRILAVDLPGHGASPATADGDALTFASAVHDAVEEAGFTDPTMVGHSLGGVVVTAYAAAFGATRVVNVDQPLRLGDFQAALHGVAPQLRGTPDEFAGVISMLFAAMDGPLPAAERARLDASNRADQDVVLSIWSSVLDAEPAELEALVDALTAPVTARYLALHGIDPGPDYPDWLTARIPTATVEVWPDHGHYPHLVDPDRFVRRLVEFIGG